MFLRPTEVESLLLDERVALLIVAKYDLHCGGGSSNNKCLLAQGHQRMSRVEDIIDSTGEQLAALTQALEQLPQFIMVTDRAGVIEYVNHAFETKTGYAREDVVGRRASILKSDRHNNEFFRRLWSTIERGKTFRNVFINRRRDGSLFREHLTISPMLDSHGQIARFVAMGTDPAPRSHRNSELLRQMKAFEIFAANFPGIVYRVNLRKKGKAQLLSKRTAALIGQTRIDVGPDFGFLIHSLMPPDDRERRRAQVEEAARRNTPFELEYRIQHADGGVRYCLEYGVPVRDIGGKPSDIYGVILDISERKRLQESLQDSEQALRELSTKLLTLQEDERRRIARELHDGIGQILTSIKMRIETANSIITQHGIEPGAEVLQSVVPMIQEAMQEVRNLSKGLRPPILDDLGINMTIAWFCRNFSKTYETIRIEVDIDVDEETVPAAVKTTIYRVLQEAMTNAAKHAKASMVGVRFSRCPEGVELVIEDNGCGFNLQETSSGHVRGFGLTSMQERVKSSGGDFAIRSTQRVGTVVRALWPVG